MNKYIYNTKTGQKWDLGEFVQKAKDQYPDRVKGMTDLEIATTVMSEDPDFQQLDVSPGGMVKNTVLGVGTELANTAKGVKDIASAGLGAVSNIAGKAWRGEPQQLSTVLPPQPLDNMKQFGNALVDDIKGYYTSPPVDVAGIPVPIEIYKNPARAATDAATVVGGVGSAAGATRIPSLVRAGKAISTAADVIDPLVAATRIGGQVGVPAARAIAAITGKSDDLQEFSRDLYIRQLHVPKYITDKERLNLFEAAKQEGILVSKHGKKKAAAKADEIKAKVDDVVSRVGNDPIDAHAIAGRARAAGMPGEFDTFSSRQAASEEISEFLTKHAVEKDPTGLFKFRDASKGQDVLFNPEQNVFYQRQTVMTPGGPVQQLRHIDNVHPADLDFSRYPTASSVANMIEQRSAYNRQIRDYWDNLKSGQLAKGTNADAVKEIKATLNREIVNELSQHPDFAAIDFKNASKKQANLISLREHISDFIDKELRSKTPSSWYENHAYYDLLRGHLMTFPLVGAISRKFVSDNASYLSGLAIRLGGGKVASDPASFRRKLRFVASPIGRVDAQPPEVPMEEPPVSSTPPPTVQVGASNNPFR